ncbi:hypothetical protein TNCV_1370901 [Trichonephila clavipes]|nr:hypothetical protein TNCV_1370901 [Trichonephila clavipes]
MTTIFKAFTDKGSYIFHPDSWDIGILRRPVKFLNFHFVKPWLRKSRCVIAELFCCFENFATELEGQHSPEYQHASQASKQRDKGTQTKIGKAPLLPDATPTKSYCGQKAVTR